MKINVGIIGYGNLGKACEELITKNENFNLVAIFSRREVVSNFGTKVEKYDDFINYRNKIDVMLLCGGSLSDLEIQTTEILEYFDCINTFDTHSKINDELSRLDKVAKKSKHRLIMSCGWDPGIFSLIRAIFYAVSDSNKPITFWGKGISLGHSDALRKTNGVVDGVQFTIPNKTAVNLAKQGLLIDNKNLPLHFRECFVVPKNDSNVNLNDIENNIISIPNYFYGQPTKVKFVTSEKLNKLKTNLSHQGEIIQFYKINNYSNCLLNFNVKMQSNALFTASIVIAYINAVINLKKHKKNGTFLPIDLPVSYLFEKEKLKEIIENLC